MSKILFTDFDETLLSTDKTISEENRNAIEKLLAAGHYIAFTTGRPLHGAKRLVEKLELPSKHCFLICFQGSFVYDLEHEKVVAMHTMDRQEMLSLVKRLQRDQIYFQAFGKDKFYCLEETDATRRYFALAGEEYEVVPDLSVLETEEIFKVMAIDFEQQEKLLVLQSEANSEEGYAFESFFSSPWFYEYCGKGQNKGEGVRVLSKYLGISLSDTVAVGDEENDVSMIEQAGVGVAMCNAREEIKAHADAVTTRDNNHAGVAEVIETYIFHNWC